MNVSRMIHADLCLSWHHNGVSHADRKLSRKMNFWRDIFPGDMDILLRSASQGESVIQDFPAGGIVPGHTDSLVCHIPKSAFAKTLTKPGVVPHLGRFYPRGVLSSAVGCFPQDIRPFRIIAMDNGRCTIDMNHPLSRIPLKLSVTVTQRFTSSDERGGSVNEIGETATENGPGMQAFLEGASTDFFAVYPLTRKSEEDDHVFYKTLRLVYHIDQTASGHVAKIYQKLLKPEFQVLDLMSSWVSHLPPSLAGLEVTGLGMNTEELRANSALSRFVVHDLNANPRLPFEEGAFDAVICTSSVEYLIRPMEVFSDVARVLKTGGIFVNTFSDRWFPPKVITLWEELHPFERMGFVLECMRKSGRFLELNTESIRGDIRPEDDKYADVKTEADPIYAVWGRRR